LVRDVPYWDADFSKPYPCPTCHDGELARRLGELSQLTGELRGVRWDNWRHVTGTDEAFVTARDYCHDPRSFLTFWGSFGCGKTRLLATITNECTAAKVGAVYYTLPDLLAVLREAVGDNAYNAQYMRLQNVRVLAIDEVDKARLTDWAREQVYQLVDARYRNRHAQGTVFAMNTQPQFDDPELGYLYSRMSEGKIIHITASDLRLRLGRTL
jgi:DNA replication protein DnaC